MNVGIETKLVLKQGKKSFEVAVFLHLQHSSLTTCNNHGASFTFLHSCESFCCIPSVSHPSALGSSISFTAQTCTPQFNFTHPSEINYGVGAGYIFNIHGILTLKAQLIPTVFQRNKFSRCIYKLQLIYAEELYTDYILQARYQFKPRKSLSEMSIIFIYYKLIYILKTEKQNNNSKCSPHLFKCSANKQCFSCVFHGFMCNIQSLSQNAYFPSSLFRKSKGALDTQKCS